MAVVRELITVLGASVDQTGFHQYETGIARIKGLALSLGKMLGVGFGVDKIIEFADGLVDAGKEINKLRLQLNLVARPMDDMDDAQKRVFETAQNLRVAYKDVLETFKQFSTEMRETKIPQDEILKTTENIYKALRVERADPEKIQEVMSVFERTFKRGAMRSVGVGQLFGLSPEIFKMLETAFKTDEEGLRALAKAGRITAEEITKAFGQTNKELDEKFAKVPVKIGDAFKVIYNDLVAVTAQIYKMTEMSSFFGRIILYVWTGFRNAIIWVTNSLGGLQNVIEVLGIALAVALGPWLLSTLASVVTLTLAWAASNAILLVGWLAIGAAIFAVAVAIQDIVFWMQGKRSVIGTWVGPFKDLAENFKKLDIFSGFRLFDDAMKGNWDAFIADWKIFVKDAPAEVALISFAILSLGTVLFTLGPILRGVIRAFRAITAEAVATKEAVVATEAVASKGAVKGAAGTQSGPRVSKVGAGLAGALQLGLLGWDLAESTNLVNSGVSKDRIGDASLGSLIGSFFGPMGTAIGAAIGALTPEIKTGVDTADKRYHSDTSKAVPVDADQLSPKIPSGSMGNVNVFDLARSLAERMWLGPEAIRNQNVVPSVTPGAVNPLAGPRVQHTEINPSLVQNNSIHVETLLDSAQIGQAIQSQMTTYGENLINGVSRQLNTAAPRSDAATQ